MAHIRLTDVSLSFPVLHGASRSLKKTLLARARASMGRAGTVPSPAGGNVSAGGEISLGAVAKDALLVRALAGLNLRIDGGERVGLVGHNGAGKTTLLRVLAGIYETSEGVLDIEGETHALIDPSSGMNPELTGRENVRLFACRMGLPPARVAVLEEEVQEFAELGAFFDLPVRLCSAGMAVRLGFAFATFPRPDILLMDEWFMAGDRQFRDKARARLMNMVEAAQIVVVTSHSLDILREWCARVVWMERGRVRMDGPADIVLDAYSRALEGGTPEDGTPEDGTP